MEFRVTHLSREISGMNLTSRVFHNFMYKIKCQQDVCDTVALKSAISAYSAIGQYHTWQCTRYGEYEHAVRSREVLITSDNPGVWSRGERRGLGHI